MMNELSYINDQGDTVFTSKYYRNRGTCCKSDCLHCPFGTTLKNVGLNFQNLELSQLSRAQLMIDQNEVEQSSIGGSLLGGAFGKSKSKKIDLKTENLDCYRYVTLKEHICGLVKVSNIKIERLYLDERFLDQGITKEIVESFYFSLDKEY